MYQYVTPIELSTTTTSEMTMTSLLYAVCKYLVIALRVFSLESNYRDKPSFLSCSTFFGLQLYFEVKLG